MGARCRRPRSRPLGVEAAIPSRGGFRSPGSERLRRPGGGMGSQSRRARPAEKESNRSLGCPGAGFRRGGCDPISARGSDEARGGAVGAQAALSRETGPAGRLMWGEPCGLCATGSGGGAGEDRWAVSGLAAPGPDAADLGSWAGGRAAARCQTLAIRPTAAPAGGSMAPPSSPSTPPSRRAPGVPRGGSPEPPGGGRLPRGSAPGGPRPPTDPPGRGTALRRGTGLAQLPGRTADCGAPGPGRRRGAGDAWAASDIGGGRSGKGRWLQCRTYPAYLWGAFARPNRDRRFT